MQSFLWRGTDFARGGALVAWSSVCRPFSDGGLGIRHLLHANSALLRKWVVRVLQPSDEMISCLLREAYGASLDWGEWALPCCGDSPLWRVFGGSSRWFSLSSGHSWGTGLISDFGRTTGWGRGDWLTAFPVSTALPRLRISQSGLHGLATGPRRYHLHSRTSEWLISWACSPSWQTLGLKRRPGSVWRQPRFSAKATYRLLCGQIPPRGLSHFSEMQAGLEATHSAEDSYIRMAPLTAVAHDPGRAPAHVSSQPCALPSLRWGPEDCSHLFFQCPLAQAAWRVAGVARLSVTSEEAFWRSLSGGFFRREADFCHSVGNLDPPERGCLQGNHPVR